MNLEPADYAGLNGSAIEALPQDQSSIADSQLLFKMVDSNADGKLSSMEIVSHLSDMGVPGRDIEQLFEELDTNNDGVVSAAGCCSTPHRLPTGQQARANRWLFTVRSGCMVVL